MTREDAQQLLEEQVELLERIRANTETQRYFIRRRELRGLGRMLQERAALINELGAVRQALEAFADWRSDPGLEPLLTTIELKRDETFRLINCVYREALAEKERIGAEVKKLRLKRQLKNQYVLKWTMLSWGNRFNEKK